MPYIIVTLCNNGLDVEPHAGASLVYSNVRLKIYVLLGSYAAWIGSQLPKLW